MCMCGAEWHKPRPWLGRTGGASADTSVRGARSPAAGLPAAAASGVGMRAASHAACSSSLVPQRLFSNGRVHGHARPARPTLAACAAAHLSQPLTFSTASLIAASSHCDRRPDALPVSCGADPQMH